MAWRTAGSVLHIPGPALARGVRVEGVNADGQEEEDDEEEDEVEATGVRTVSDSEVPQYYTSTMDHAANEGKLHFRPCHHVVAVQPLAVACQKSQASIGQ